MQDVSTGMMLSDRCLSCVLMAICSILCCWVVAALQVD